jgi:hypothetical protein
MDYLASLCGCCDRHNNHWQPGRMAAAASTLIEEKVAGKVVLGKKDDWTEKEEEVKMGKSEDASNDQSYSISNKNNYNTQPQQWW